LSAVYEAAVPMSLEEITAISGLAEMKDESLSILFNPKTREKL
jgi:hypothetical protein